MDEKEKPPHLDLFTGIGGFALAASWAGFETKGFCEIDPFCQQIIAKRFLANTERERQPQLHGCEPESGGRARDRSKEIAAAAYSQRGRREQRDKVKRGIQQLNKSSNVSDDALKRLQGERTRRNKESQAHEEQEIPLCSGSNGAVWIPEPAVGFSSDGIPAELDGGINGTSNQSDSTEVLFALWKRIAPQAIQRTAGGLWCVPTSEVLLAGMHGEGLCQRHIGKICEAEAGYEIPWEDLRVVWHYEETSLPSHRRESEQRLYDEHPDLMRLLSYYAPPPCPSCWSDGSWEIGLSRVAKGVSERVDRLRGLGNAIVPQVAYQFLRAIRSQLT